MDTKTPIEVKAAEQQATIKASMPDVYKAVLLAERSPHVGAAVWAWVGRGLRGEPDCFYAMEAGYVVGTPFAREGAVSMEAARDMVRFGLTHVAIFGFQIQWKG